MFIIHRETLNIKLASFWNENVMMGRIGLFFLVLILQSSFVFGLSEFIFDYIGVDQGLSNPVVNSIYQDNKGFMLFGIFYSLNR